MIFNLTPLGYGISMDMVVWLCEHVGPISKGRTILEGKDYHMAGDGWHLTYSGYKPMLEIIDDNAALLFKLTWL